MERAMKSICELSLPLGVYGPMRLTHNTPMGSYDGLGRKVSILEYPSLVGLAGLAGPHY
jgi:hypothetical protein